MKKIGIITSGGDCGGLNAVIKGAALTANEKGISCYVIPNGYAGLYNLVDFNDGAGMVPGSFRDGVQPDRVFKGFGQKPQPVEA